MSRITTHLWFDKEAKEAAEFYTSVFPNSRVKHTTRLHDTPSGSVDIVTADVFGEEFSLLSAGPLFQFNPSVSFLVACRTKEEARKYWQALSKGGNVRMDFGSYPFSEAYGWTEDKFGLSWQVIFVGERPVQRNIAPELMFVGAVSGKAEEAIRYYASVFQNAKVGEIHRQENGTVQFATFTLEGQDFAAMDGGNESKFGFNEAISFMVHCETQQDVDYYWGKLTAVPSAEACGWLKDKYGFSWQIVPAAMERMLASKDEKKLAKLTETFLKMKKFDIATLEAAVE